MNRTDTPALLKVVFPFVVVATLLLGACGSSEGYPSLARRPAERISGTAPAVEAPPAPPPAPVAPDLGLQSRLARWLEQARGSHARFNALRPRAAQLTSAAQGAAVASEGWAVATVALAELESRRSDVLIALAELDAVYVKERIDGGDGVTISAVRDQITAWIADEDAVLTELRGRLQN